MARTKSHITNVLVLRFIGIDKDSTLHNGDGLFMIAKTSEKKI